MICAVENVLGLHFKEEMEVGVTSAVVRNALPVGFRGYSCASEAVYLMDSGCQ